MTPYFNEIFVVVSFFTDGLVNLPHHISKSALRVTKGRFQVCLPNRD